MTISSGVVVVANVIAALATGALAYLTYEYLKATRELVKESHQTRESQKELQERQLKQDLYRKRIEVFHSLMGFLADFGRDARVAWPQCVQLLRDTREAEFLFPDQAADVINQTYRKATEWHESRSRDERSEEPTEQAEVSIARAGAMALH